MRALACLCLFALSAVATPALTPSDERALAGAATVGDSMPVAPSDERALAGSGRSLNTQTEWTNDPGCTGPTAFDSGTGYCYAYSCAPRFGTGRIISTGACPCMNSNDCFYAWRGTSATTAATQHVCSGADQLTNSFGTCVQGPSTPAIIYTGPSVDQNPNAGCSAQNPCSSGGRCYRAKCPAKSQCGSDFCGCTSDSDCVGSFLASLYTPQCISGQCRARRTNPALTTCSTCTADSDGYWCPSASACYLGFAKGTCSGFISSPSGCPATSCSAGQYLSSGTCLSCAAGTAYGGGSASSCPQCAANTFSGSGASSCTSCPSGQTSAAGSASCTAPSPYSCSAGAYNTNAGSTIFSCSQCAANTYSGPGARSCTDCPSGQTSAPGSTSSAACSAPAATSCPGGQYLSPTGSCTACGAGTAYAGGGASSCSQCAANTYSGGGASACTACPSGQTSVPGSTSSAACSTPSSTTGTSLVVQPSTGCTSGSSASNGGNGCTENSVLGAWVRGNSCTPGSGLTFDVYSSSACTIRTTQYTVPFGTRLVVWPRRAFSSCALFSLLHANTLHSLRVPPQLQHILC